MNHYFKGKLAGLKIGDPLQVVSHSGVEGSGLVSQINKDAVMVASVKTGDKDSLPGGHSVFAFPTTDGNPPKAAKAPAKASPKGGEAPAPVEAPAEQEAAPGGDDGAKHFDQ